jgi:hypothetical protein
MAAKTYPVGCECGATIHVPGTSAGTTFTCQCGRQVEVPGLARLKASVGQAVLSADLELQHLTAAEALPLEKDCVICGRTTDDQVAYRVVCERPETKGRVPLWQQVLLMGLSPLLYVFHMSGQRVEVHGRDVAFRLPVRVCEGCAQTLTTPAAVRDAMDETPVYARLFDKYPDAKISNAD